MATQVKAISATLMAVILFADPGAPALSQQQLSQQQLPQQQLPQQADPAEPVSEADQAYVAPVKQEPALPSLPPTPVLDMSSYPDCREDFQNFEAPFDKAEDTNRCTLLLDQFYASVLTPFRQRMIDYQNELSALYTNQVGGQPQYSHASQDRFYQEMMQEHARSDPDGPNLADYRATESRYQQDRAYLQDRFCFNTGCGGYAAPTYYTDKPVEKADTETGNDKPGKDSQGKKDSRSAKKSSGGKKCKKARKRGGILGGVIGGVVGDAAGLGTIGTIISSGVGAVLVSEIACQLTDKEQKKAVEATEVVTEKEEVGAVATWKSPTREGVSGSSTVTALNTEPSGRKCLSITDVAIIDGEETRISKQMCRGQGEQRYSIVA